LFGHDLATSNHLCTIPPPIRDLVENSKSKNLLNILIVGGSTVSSRIAGLFRDILIFSTFGTSVHCSAFLFAFTLPNLFRRLLGEGALTSALIPVMARELEETGKPGFYTLLNKVMSQVGLLLLVLVAIGSGTMWGISQFAELSERISLGLFYGMVLFPYLIMICLSAVCGGALNSLGRFGAVALTPVALNLCMIFSLGVLATFFGETEQEKVLWLCGGVLFGGLLQWLMPAAALWSAGWKPALDFHASPEIKRTWELFVPGVAGASILQVNLLVSRSLAFSLDDSTVAILFLASRLVELPLGIFTIAVTTVVFPQIAKLKVQQEHERFHVIFQKGLLWVLVLTIPAAAGLAVLAEPILDFLFKWGVFDDNSVQQTVPILQLSALGLPFYSAVAMYTRGFHAQEDMQTPLKGSVQVLISNLILSLVLMRFYGIYGLATAGVLTSIWQSAYLHRHFDEGRGILNADLLRILAASALMAVVCHFLWKIENTYLGTGKISSFLYVLNLIPVGIGVYLFSLWLFRFSEFDEMYRKIILRVFARKG
jgi:putative peptidoglycan lipid II flippase